MRRLEVLGKGQSVLPVARLLTKHVDATGKEISALLIAELEQKGVKYTDDEREQITSSVYNLLRHRDDGGVSDFFTFDTYKSPYKWNLSLNGWILNNDEMAQAALKLYDNLDFVAYNEAVKELNLAQRDPYTVGDYTKEESERGELDAEVETERYIWGLRDNDEETPLDKVVNELILEDIDSIPHDVTYEKAKRRLDYWYENIDDLDRFGLLDLPHPKYTEDQEPVMRLSGNDLKRGKGPDGAIAKEVCIYEYIRRHKKGFSNFVAWNDANALMLYRQLIKSIWLDPNYEPVSAVGELAFTVCSNLRGFLETFEDIQEAYDKGYIHEYLERTNSPKSLLKVVLLEPKVEADIVDEEFEVEVVEAPIKITRPETKPNIFVRFFRWILSLFN